MEGRTTTLAVALAWLCAASAAAQPVRDLELEVLEDPTGALRIEDVTRPPWSERFGPMPGGRPLGRSRSAFWVRAPLGRLAPEHEWLVELAHAEADDVRVYWPEEAGWRAVTTGDRTPFATREVAHPTFVFRAPEGATALHARVQMEGGVQVPLRLWRADAFEAHARELALGLGAFYGLLLALALYNLFLFITTRERGYLYYVAFQLGVLAFTTAFEGHGAMYLWPSTPAWAHVAGPFFLALAYGFGALFLREMTNVRAFAPRLAAAMRAVAGVNFAIAGLALFAYEAATAVLELGSVLAIVLTPVPIVLSLRRGWTPSRYLLLGWLAMGPLSALGALRALAVIEDGFLARHGFECGVALDALLFSMALAERIRVLRREKERAEDDALELQRRAAAAEEDERRRIAADLHDGIGQTLQVLIARAESGADAGPLGALARESVGELRRVARDLHPHELERLGLAEASRRVSERALEAAGIEPEIVVEDVDEAIPRSHWISVYRVLQEALANVVRHARAAHAIVSLRREGGALVLCVEDDGAGLAPDATPGMGSASVRERARLLSATVAIEPVPEGGTRLTLRVPIA